MKRKSIVGSYMIKGILVGLFFPLLAIIIVTFFLSPENQVTSLKNIHKNFPLMWIIDTAPLVLGVISYIVGSEVNKSNNNHLNRIENINKELVDKNVLLNTLINDKEILLKEVHHRVKNNLQVIISLLRLQSRYIEDANSKILFANCQYRIKSMALIHEMLYKSNGMTKINCGEYVDKLIKELITSMKGEQHNIDFKFNNPKIDISLDTAIPLGLLLNEVITNSLKYGIINESRGVVSIEITKLDENSFKALVGDDGVGFSNEINVKNTNSIGLKLIERLVFQLKGNIEKIQNKKGTNYAITFQEIG